MPLIGETLLVGLGSPHGDDAAGWRIAQAIASAAPAGVHARCAATPLRLLDWLDGAARLVVCDACESNDRVGSVYNGRWPDAAIENRRGTGSHDFSLVQTLELAERLGRLPPEVWVYAIAGRQFEPGATLSPELEAALPAIIEQILGDLRDARTLAGQGAAGTG